MKKIRILISDGLDQAGLALLKAEPSFAVDVRSDIPPSELLRIIADYNCIIVRTATQVTKEVLARAQNMRLVVRAGAGLDNIDVETARDLNICVRNTASANAAATAEHTIALLFAMLRHIPEAALSLRAGRWDREAFKGREVSGKTIGIIGLGNVGRLVAEKASALGMKVTGYDIEPKAMSGHNRVWLARTLDELICNVDIVTLHVPKTPDTFHLINAEKISKMMDQSYLINCARGGIVDEKAVLAALDSGKLAAAAFDVFENESPIAPNPLFTHPRVVCTPHIGAATREASSKVGLTAAKTILDFFREP